MTSVSPWLKEVVDRAAFFQGWIDNGGAVQVEPIKPTLKAPGTKLFKLQYDRPLSNFASKFKLRRYTTASPSPSRSTRSSSPRYGGAG
jgi:hypothetical protein